MEHDTEVVEESCAIVDYNEVTAKETERVRVTIYSSRLCETIGLSGATNLM